jgi:hypothetical protein
MPSMTEPTYNVEAAAPQPVAPAPVEEPKPYNSHGLDLTVVGGNTFVPESVPAELAAAAYDANSAVIYHDGESFLAPIDKISTDAVELACNDEGCVLIQDDGIAENDVIVPGM